VLNRREGAWNYAASSHDVFQLLSLTPPVDKVCIRNTFLRDIEGDTPQPGTGTAEVGHTRTLLDLWREATTAPSTSQWSLTSFSLADVVSKKPGSGIFDLGSQIFQWGGNPSTQYRPHSGCPNLREKMTVP
jgi:hypothetical protein